MIITKNLLKNFIDLSKVSDSELYAKLNSIGLEVESVQDLRVPKNVVVGKVLEKTAHPNADKLSVCKVDVGAEVLQIVCGAKNVAKDEFVAVALVGAKLPSAKKDTDSQNASDSEFLEIKPAKLRDVDSFGMLCSATELGLPKINDGILLLDKSIGELVLGKQLADFEIFNDSIIELSITPNRGDCLSVLGVARDIAAAFDLRLKSISDVENISALGLGRVLSVSVDSAIDAALLYRIAEIKSISMPLQITIYLALAGNLRADVVQNFLEYSTYMTGVIMNAYRLQDCKTQSEKVQASLNITRDSSGVQIVCANGKTLSRVGLAHDDSKEFSTRSETIILESSYIAPDIVSQSIYEKKNSESELKNSATLTFRTTRGSNPNLEDGMNFLGKILLSSNAKDTDILLYSGTHNVSQKMSENRIKTTFQSMSDIIGNELSREEMTRILKQLNFEIDATADEKFFMVNVPNYRHDIKNIQDVCEEILRIYGIDNVRSKPLEFKENLRLNAPYRFYKLTREIAKSLIANGLKECVHYVFGNSSAQKKLGLKTLDSEFELLNPITAEMDTLRTSLMPQMLHFAQSNINIGYKNIALFEIGSAYGVKRDEKKRLCVFVAGNKIMEHYPHPKGKAWDFGALCQILKSAIGDFELKNVRDCLDSEICTNFENFNFENPNIILHPFQSAFIYKNGACIGVFGALNPSLEFENAFIFELDLQNLKDEITHASAFSVYQKSLRDLTILIDSDICFSKIRDCLKAAKIQNLKEIYPLDVYVENQTQHALSLRLVLQSDSGTLKDSQINEITESVLKILQENFGAQLKG